MRQAGFEAHIGRENILPHVQAALERAQEIAASRHHAPEAKKRIEGEFLAIVELGV